MKELISNVGSSAGAAPAGGAAPAADAAPAGKGWSFVIIASKRGLESVHKAFTLFYYQ